MMTTITYLSAKRRYELINKSCKPESLSEEEREELRSGDHLDWFAGLLELVKDMIGKDSTPEEQMKRNLDKAEREDLLTKAAQRAAAYALHSSSRSIMDEGSSELMARIMDEGSSSEQAPTDREGNLNEAEARGYIRGLKKAAESQARTHSETACDKAFQAYWDDYFSKPENKGKTPGCFMFWKAGWDASRHAPTATQPKSEEEIEYGYPHPTCSDEQECGCQSMGYAMCWDSTRAEREAGIKALKETPKVCDLTKEKE